MSSATSALEFVLSAIDKTKPGFDSAGDNADATSSRMSKFGNVAQGAGLVAGAAAVKFGLDSVKAYGEAEDAQKELGFAFEKFPALADTNQKKLQDLNSALQKKTKYDDDNIASGQAVLAQFELTGNQIEDVTPLLLDYADKMGKDIPGAAQDVGKALLGNAKALKSIGISYKSTGDSTTDFANITQMMRDKVGGFAEQEGKTASGQAAILDNQFGELQETTGALLLPALKKVTAAGVALLGWMSDHSTATKIAVGVVLTLAAAYGAMSVAQTVGAGISAIRTIALGSETAATTAATAATVPFAASLWAATWPILAIVAAIALVAFGVYELVTHWDTVTAAIGTGWDWVQGKLVGGYNWLKDNWPLLLAILTGPFGLATLWIVKNWDKVGEFFGGIGDKIASGFKSAFRVIALVWNDTIGKLDWQMPKIGPFGGAHIKGPTMNVPALAGGGILTSPTLFYGGEGGEPEAVVPLSKAGQFGFGGGPRTIEVPIYLDGRLLARGVYEANLRDF